MSTDRAYLALPPAGLEDVLSDLDRPDIFVGPVWGYFPIVEIQSSIASVLELPVEGLAGDFLGVRVRLILLCVIRMAIDHHENWQAPCSWPCLTTPQMVLGSPYGQAGS